jgi:UDP-N-acetylmuramoylalanine--D-glutamate ligase
VRRERQYGAWAGELAGRLAVVVGSGRSGLAAARLVHAVGGRVRLLEADAQADAEAIARQVPFAEIKVAPHEPVHFRDAAWVVPSPGVPLRRIRPLLGEVPEERVIAEMELAARFCEEPVVAVTGSNGKTTAVELASFVLARLGRKVFTGGNIGQPLSEYVLEEEPAEALVLEVSSFQLQTCRSFRPLAGVLLNVSANHLDYHEDMQEYLEAKLRLFQAQMPGDVAVVPEAMLPDLGRDFTRARIKTFAPRGRINAPHLPGAHNQANMEAVLAALEPFGIDESEAMEAMADFRPPAHRLQELGAKRGVRFVDDSKATNLGAVDAALSAFDGPLRLLLGGVFKGGDPAELIPSMQGKVVQIGLYGSAREVFEEALAAHFETFWEPDLETATRRLYAGAAPGDVILLSPATASFDQYASYAQRGEHFRRIFEELP